MSPFEKLKAAYNAHSGKKVLNVGLKVVGVASAAVVGKQIADRNGAFTGAVATTGMAVCAIQAADVMTESIDKVMADTGTVVVEDTADVDDDLFYEEGTEDPT